MPVRKKSKGENFGIFKEPKELNHSGNVKYKEGGDESGEASRGQNPEGFLAMVRSLNSIPTAVRNCWPVFKVYSDIYLRKITQATSVNGLEGSLLPAGEPTSSTYQLLVFILVCHLKCPSWKVEGVCWRLRVRVWIATQLTRIACQGETPTSPCTSAHPKSPFCCLVQDTVCL